MGKTDSELIVVIDCGANIGHWSAELCKSFSRSTGGGTLEVYAFEPSAFTYKLLQINVKQLEIREGSITPINMALSSSEGSAELNIVHPGAGTNSLNTIEGESNGQTEPVILKKLDTFAREQGLANITLLKIDSEGHDAEVLKGAKDLLAESRIDVIQFEYNWRWIYEGHLLRDVFCQLTEKGYRIGKLTPKGIQFYPCYNAALETFEEANFIACKPEWVNRFPIVPAWYLKRGEEDQCCKPS